MTVKTETGTSRVAEFLVDAVPPDAARMRAASAFRDTIGVILAGALEPAAQIVRGLAGNGQGECRILGTPHIVGPEEAAMANGVAAHALDYDDMCFVSLAHPSCALVPAALATAEFVQASGTAIIDAYLVGFELECRLGNVMNPRHYHERGWHCTSSIGTLGAAAAAARILGLDIAQTRHALGIAASTACGLKENLGTMVKPLHAGVAARNGVMAARLAREGFIASEQALDGPQGYLAVMDSQEASLDDAVADLGTRWEILETGITVKLYPCCAATHPPLDAVLELVRREAITPEQVDTIDVEVDSMTPRLLIYDQPATGLEAKFSLPFCAASAIVHGRPDIETFSIERIQDPAVQALMRRVTLRASPAYDEAAPLSQARVTVRLRDGRTVSQSSDGARGYPGRLTDEELAVKFDGCARRSMPQPAIVRAWKALMHLNEVSDVRKLTELFQSPGS